MQEAAMARGLAAAPIAKGKRTKRRRAAARAEPPGAAEAASPSGAEEEDDMAHCLMLLSRGHRSPEKPADAADSGGGGREARFRSRRPAGGGEAGEYVYECRTCSKCFPSFQALGGHRASHRKPRPPPPPSPAAAGGAAPEAKNPAVADSAGEANPMPAGGGDASGCSKPQPRSHECSICGSEFASGQALGGHMRRHRPLPPGAAAADAAASASPPRKEKSLLELDLNLPAPCDGGGGRATDTSETSAQAFVFSAGPAERAVLFPAAASALVDCHY